MSGQVFPLVDNQQLAVDPARSVWLSASAGTGKTQVLSARVLRLLLREDVKPADILCLTFTKAGAAEMAVRINQVLARWVRLDATRLAKELGYIGAAIDRDTQARARTLFARVLDCPGGGLRIDTIHAFSQWLLGNFPIEAGMAPGARPMEERERDALAREVLAHMLSEAEREDDHVLLEAAREFSRRKAPEEVRDWVMRCARMPELWEGPGAFTAPMRARAMQLLGLPGDADEGWVQEALSPATFPDEALRAMEPALQVTGNKTSEAALAAITQWFGLSEAERASRIDLFAGNLLTQKGEARAQGFAKTHKAEPRFAQWQDALVQAIGFARERAVLLDLGIFLGQALELGRNFALRWEDAKAREGWLELDDLIRRAAVLLEKREASEWIRFKLDRQFDHILVDEAQDTNAAQWKIFDALIDDFFAGEGAGGDTLRTVFTVGDYKQAIFGFQGTSPANFEAAKARVKKAMGVAAQGAAQAKQHSPAEVLADLDLGRSFRTANVVLQFVDRMIEAIGHEAFGLQSPPPAHVGEERAGLVTLWRPVQGAEGADREGEGEGDLGEEGWLARHDRQMAERIALQVHAWLNGDEPFVLAKADKPRRAGAGDIMVLVRSRKELANLIVARLHAKGVPVAGVDRLRLGAPLAVKDLMAAVRFAAQPFDDLNLANLLSSPLMGWSQDDLLAHVPRAKGQALWDHLRACKAPKAVQTTQDLRDLLRRADFDSPHALMNWMLVGPWKGRKKLIARLGHEANDPIDELLNAALKYEQTQPLSLAGFIRWFDGAEDELKRDPSEARDEVRVMTVHGSKGLQAPIVILADAAAQPGKVGELAVPDPFAPAHEPRHVPVPAVRREQRAGILEDIYEAEKAEQMREHWRLLYVAMTRAEEALFIGGALGGRSTELHPDSWYARLEPQFAEGWVEDAIWGARREWGYRAPWPDDEKQPEVRDSALQFPTWAVSSLPEEPRPARPLAPSDAGEDRDIAVPSGAASAQGAAQASGQDTAQDAARRGVLIHALLERLPHVAQSDRAKAARAWLEHRAHDFSHKAREAMAEQALEVINAPQFAEVFSPDALAEVPLAAQVGDRVVAGIADRLLVTREEVTVVDFKTTRHPPRRLEDIPQTTLTQMRAYICALKEIYPGRKVRAGVLYTHVPVLFALDHAMQDQPGAP